MSDDPAAPKLNISEQSPEGAAAPITPEAVRSILNTPGILTDTYRPPSAHDCAWLATTLDGTRKAVALSRANGPHRAAKVAEAMAYLGAYFDDRAREVETIAHAGNAPLPEIVKAERTLAARFGDFAEAFAQHDFRLVMDRISALDSWKEIALSVANSFQMAMRRNNPNAKLGFSNNGPVQRFVAAMVPLITGETPAVGTVSNHLKATAAEKERRAQTYIAAQERAAQERQASRNR